MSITRVNGMLKVVAKNAVVIDALVEDVFPSQEYGDLGIFVDNFPFDNQNETTVNGELIARYPFTADGNENFENNLDALFKKIVKELGADSAVVKLLKDNAFKLVFGYMEADLSEAWIGHIIAEINHDAGEPLKALRCVEVSFKDVDWTEQNLADVIGEDDAAAFFEEVDYDEIVG